MERKRAFIHIGLAKTGTKSIQLALAQRRSKLARAGWVFPKEGSTNRSGHHGFAWYLEGATHQHPGLQRFDLATFKAAIVASDDKNIIISSEGLSALSANEKRIRSLLSYFPNHDVVAIAYVREQAQLVNSFYGEFLSNLADPGPIEAFATRALQQDLYNYLRYFRLWKMLLGKNLIVRPYDLAELKDGDIVEDFAQLLEIGPALKPYPIDRQNTGNNVLQVAVLIGLIRRLSDMKQHWEPYSPKHRHLKAVVTGILSDPDLQGAEPYWGLDSTWAQQLRQHYKETNEAFFLEMLQRKFEFGAVGTPRRYNAITYQDLAPGLRTRLEDMLIAGLEAEPVYEGAHAFRGGLT
jgi:hypothetical protein